MFSRSGVFRAGLLSLLAVVLAGFSVPSFAYDWQTVAPKNGGFSADFPGAPRFTFNTADNATTYVWVYRDEVEKVTVVAGATDYYGGIRDVDSKFRGEEEGFLRESDGKATSHSRGEIMGASGEKLPTLTFSFVTRGGVKGVSRMIVDGATVYMSVVMWPSGVDGSAVLKRFQASYKLLPRTMPPKPPIPDTSHEDWQTVAPKNGGFSADFPGKPGLVSRTVQSGYMYAWIYADEKQKLVVTATTIDFYSTHPNAALSVSERLHRGEKSFLESIKGSATSSEPGQTMGANGKMLPSLTFTYVSGNGWEGVSKAIADGNTLYTTLVMWKKGINAAEVRKRFMASYKLLPRIKPPRPPEAGAADEGLK